MNRPQAKPTTYTQTFFTYGMGGSMRVFPITFKLNRELVPVGEEPRTFQGYPTFFHALAVASTTANIGLVYQASLDPKISRRESPFWFGRFFVFDTGMRPFPPSRGRPMAAHVLPEGVINVHFTNLVERQDGRTWDQRMKEIIDHKGTGLTLYPLLKALVEDFANLDGTEVNADPAVENVLLDEQDRVRLFKTDKVNIYYGDPTVKNPAVAAGVPGYTEIINSPTGTAKIFCDKSSSDLPQTCMALTRGVLQGNHNRHPTYLRSTLAHEAVHLYHIHRATFLLEQWRKSPGKHKAEFVDWARNQSRQRNSGVSKYDVLTIMKFCASGGSALMHFEPHVEAWILTATYLPTSELGLTAAITEDLTEIQTDYYYPSRELNSVQNHLKPRLVKTYNGLSDERKEAIVKSLRIYLRSERGRKSNAFIRWLFEIWSVSN